MQITLIGQIEMLKIFFLENEFLISQKFFEKVSWDIDITQKYITSLTVNKAIVSLRMP